MTGGGDVNFPDDENGDVFRRMQQSGFDFALPHDVEFFAFFATETDADACAMMFVADRAAGDPLVGIETRPSHRGGMEPELVRRMVLTHDAVTAFERLFRQRADAHGGTLDGWGVLQA